jgi:hypothetical protein
VDEADQLLASPAIGQWHLHYGTPSASARLLAKQRPEQVEAAFLDVVCENDPARTSRATA